MTDVLEFKAESAKNHPEAALTKRYTTGGSKNRKSKKKSIISVAKTGTNTVEVKHKHSRKKAQTHPNTNKQPRN